MKWLAALALGTILQPSLALRDVDGITREPLKVAKGHFGAMFFVTNDCPVSNYYSHEIRRICDDYAKRGVGCSLIALMRWSRPPARRLRPPLWLCERMGRSPIAGASTIPSRRLGSSAAW
jgi:hypothetical protein